MKVSTKLIAMMVVAAGVAASSGMFVIGSEAEAANPSLFRSAGSDCADAPSGRLVLRVPASDASNSGAPRTEDNAPPAEPDGPDVEDEVPTFFGEPVKGSWVMVLDNSYSMTICDAGSIEDEDGNIISNASRLERVKLEAIGVVKAMSSSDQFDFVLCSGCQPQYMPCTDAWKGTLVPCSDTNRAEAVEYLRGLFWQFGTPTHPALERATRDYPSDGVDTIVFLSDGVPIPREIAAVQNSGKAGGTGDRDHKRAVLDDMPIWYAPFAQHGCKAIIVQMGRHVECGEFLQELATRIGGTFKQY